MSTLNHYSIYPSRFVRMLPASCTLGSMNCWLGGLCTLAH